MALKASTSPIPLYDIDVTFHKNIRYGSEKINNLDIFIPKSQTPTAIAIYIHGGGFIKGNKEKIYKFKAHNHPEDIRRLLKNGIAVASINYSKLKNTGETIGVQKCLDDIALSIQYIKSKSLDFNIDKKNVILVGSSAGAGAALYISTHDDMKDETSLNHVYHESTKVKAITLFQPQSSYFLERWEEIFTTSNWSITWKQFLKVGQNKIFQFYGVSSLTEYKAKREQLKSLDMLSAFCKDAAPLFIESTKVSNKKPKKASKMNHHPNHAAAIKAAADAAGVRNVCYYGNPIQYSDPSGISKIDFIIQEANRK